MKSILTFLFIVFYLFSQSITRISTGNGNWATAGTWSPNGVPSATDDIIVLSGHTITMNGNTGTCLSLTVNGTLDWTQARTTNVGAGGLTLNNGALIGGNSNGALIVAGNLSIAVSQNVTVNDIVFTINGTSNISGTINFNNTGGTKTFTTVNLLSGGVWRSGAGETYNMTNFNLTSGTINSTGNNTGRFSITNNLTVNAGTSTMNRCRINSGSLVLNGTLNITSTAGAKNLTNVTINTGGNLNCTVNESFNISGNFANSGSFTSGNGTYTYNGLGRTFSGTSNSIFNGTFRCNGTLTNNGIITINNILNGTGTFTQGNGTLNMNATTANFSVTNFNGSGNGNTVNYGMAGAQVIRNGIGSTYHHLTLSGSGVKTISANTNINGNLTINSSLDVSGTIYSLNVAGNWLNTGTFICRTGTVTFSGTTQSITKATGETFHILNISGTGVKSLGGPITVNNNLTIISTLDVSASNYAIAVKGNWINNGTFVAQQGTVTLNGTLAQTISGNNSSFYNLTLNNTAGASLACTTDLYNVLTITSGTFTTTGQTFTLISNASGTASIGPITGNITGNVTQQRFLSPASATDWRLIGSCKTGTTLSDFDDDFITSGFPGSQWPNFGWVSVYTYNESTPLHKDSGWVVPTSISNAVANGKGVLAYIGPNPVTIDLTGTINKFGVALPVSFTSSAGGVNEDGWNLVANPYPSTIDWDASGWTKTNIDNNVQIWNPNAQQFSSYAAGVGTNGGSRYIPSTQGFWVKANAASPVLSVTENVKSAQNPTYMKNNSTFTANLLRLKISGNNLSDETVIRFDAAATPAFDQALDAPKWASYNVGAPYLSSLIGNEDESINSLPNGSVSVDLRARVGVSGSYTITLDSTSSLNPAACVILEDKLTNTFTDLFQNPNYNFNILDTTKASRFVLHIGGSIMKTSLAPTCNGNSNGLAIATVAGSGNLTYNWYNSSQQLIQSNTHANGIDTLQNITAGIYMLIINGNLNGCTSLQDTFIVNQPDVIQINTNVTTATCKYSNDGQIDASLTSGGTSPYLFIWNNGQSGTLNSNLTVGTYTLSIVDANNCTTSQIINVGSNSILNSGFTMADTLDLGLSSNIQINDNSVGTTQWFYDFGNGTQSTSPSNNVIYTQTGNYLIQQVVYDANCSDTITKNLVVINSTIGILETLSNGLQIATENNNNHYYVLNNKNEKLNSIELYDLQGRKIKCLNNANVLSSNKILIPTEGLSSGIYPMIIRSEKSDFRFKLTITN